MILTKLASPTQEAFPVKRISSKQSRRNSARRRRQVATRHARAGHWSPRAEPMFTSGKVDYEIGANPDVMSYGGIASTFPATMGSGAPWGCGMADALREYLSAPLRWQHQ